jgi:hypothetical protein
MRMARLSKAKELEELLKGKINPEIVAFGQALAEAMQKLPEGQYRIEVAVDGQIETRLSVREESYEYELVLIYPGKWMLAGHPNVYI